MDRFTGPSARVLDSTRTHLDILRDTLGLLREHNPTFVRNECERTDCAVCGFPLSGGPIRSDLEHSTFREWPTSPPCSWIRAIAELEAWIAVEEKLAEARESVSSHLRVVPRLRALSPTELEVLRRASKRTSGYVCPTPGLHGIAQTSVIEKLRADGFVTSDGAPVITEDGHAVLAFNGD
jgi:hypothetical protein